MAEPRQPLGIRKEGTGVICGSPTPLWRFPAETYKRGSSSIDPEILAWLRPAKLKRRKIKPAAVDQSWEAVERAVQMRLNNLAKTPRRPPMMKPRMTPHTLATDEATRGRDDAARHARQEEADRRLAQRLQRAEETAAAEFAGRRRSGGGSSSQARRPAARPIQRQPSASSASPRGSAAARAAAESGDVAGANAPGSAEKWLAMMREREEKMAAAKQRSSPTLGADEAALLEGEGGAQCMVCCESVELLLCRGYREASDSDGKASIGHILCRPCLERWHLAKNELLEANGQLPKSRRECPVCKSELRGSSMRADKDQCMGLRKLQGTWPAEPEDEEEEEEEEEGEEDETM